MKCICINSFKYNGYEYCKGDVFDIDDSAIHYKVFHIRDVIEHWFWNTTPKYFRRNFITIEEYRNQRIEEILTHGK